MVPFLIADLTVPGACSPPSHSLVLRSWLTTVLDWPLASVSWNLLLEVKGNWPIRLHRVTLASSFSPLKKRDCFWCCGELLSPTCFKNAVLFFRFTPALKTMLQPVWTPFLHPFCRPGVGGNRVIAVFQDPPGASWNWTHAVDSWLSLLIEGMVVQTTRIVSGLWSALRDFLFFSFLNAVAGGLLWMMVKLLSYCLCLGWENCERLPFPSFLLCPQAHLGWTPPDFLSYVPFHFPLLLPDWTLWQLWKG